MMAWWFIGGGIFAMFGMMVALWLCSYNGSQEMSETQREAVREWLLYAVTVAERDWGSGTGKIKLRCVYDWFAQRFPDLCAKVGFDEFSKWVEDALVTMRKLLCTNQSLRARVEGGENE